jgi:hypothetical protein
MPRLSSETSYKYYINRKWNMKKSIPTSKKLAMCNVLQTRAQAGKSTNMKFKDKEVDLKKLRRAMKEHARQQITMRPVARGYEAEATNISHPIVPFGNTMYVLIPRNICTKVMKDFIS